MAPAARHRKAVVFDLDGVLVDSEPLHVEAWKTLFARHGIIATDEEFNHGIGMVDADWIRYIFARRGQSVDLARWRDAKREVFRDILARDVRPLPGAASLVRRLHPEFRLGVASNSWRENIETVLEEMGLRACFETLIGLDDVEHHKPHPEGYLRVAAGLSVPPGACTVIEDSPLGVQAAVAAGMRCVGVTSTLPAEKLAGADLIVETLEDAERIVSFARSAPKPR